MKAARPWFLVSHTSNKCVGLAVQVEDHMKIATDEIFGPVQSILKYKTIDEVRWRTTVSHSFVGPREASYLLDCVPCVWNTT